MHRGQRTLDRRPHQPWGVACDRVAKDQATARSGAPRPRLAGRSVSGLHRRRHLALCLARGSDRRTRRTAWRFNRANHWRKAEAAEQLYAQGAITTNFAPALRTLNVARKEAVYDGEDPDFGEQSLEDLASEVESAVDLAEAHRE